MPRQEYPRKSKRFGSAFAPFPRSSWAHPHVPYDNFDRVCKDIWRRAKQAAEELGGGRSSSERQQNKDYTATDSGAGHRAGKQQRKTDDLGLSAPYKEDKQQYHTDFILPCPYLLGRRHPRVAKPARVLSPVMEEEMKQNEAEAKGKGNLRAEEDKQSVENSFKKISVAQSSFRRDQLSFSTEPQPPNPVCSAAEDHASFLQEDEDPPILSKIQRDACESEDEMKISNCSDSNPSDDGDLATLPGLRSVATDSGDDSASDSNSCNGEKYEIPHSDELSSDSEQDSPAFSKENDFPPLPTIEAGILPRPTEPPASGKMHGQWEIPLSFHPHVIPTATLASGVTAQAQASVQGKAQAPQADSETEAAPAAPSQQEAYDLLADFPALRPPKEPLILGVWLDGNPKTRHGEAKRELAHTPDQSQASGASHQRRMENMPHEISSICARDQKTELDLQTLGSSGQRNSPTVSCEQPKANTQPPPRVAGTDGVGVNARSWASAAKAGMKRAAAPQEKARPCAFQQIVTINRAKVGYSATHNFPSKATPFHQTASPWVTAACRGFQPRNPNGFIRPGNPHIHQFGALAHQATRPGGFRCPRFPFQQARGHPPKHCHV